MIPPRLIVLLIGFGLLAACSNGELSVGQGNPPDGDPNNAPDNNRPNNQPDNPRELPPFEPAPATLHRLTAEQYRTTVRDLFDVYVPVELEVDTTLHGYVSVAASELTLPPLAVEQYEEAAWYVAEAITGNPETRQALLGCDPGQDTCLRSWIVRTGLRAWRRPLTLEEVNQIAGVARQVAQAQTNPWRGVAAAVSLMLQSPHFLFRVEKGEPDPLRAPWRRFTDYEMAARLSYFLWGTTPDDVLLAAAARGALVTDEGLAAEAQRLLDDPRAEDRMMGFFAEYIGLSRLDEASKDAEDFPELDRGLRNAMRREIELLFHEIVFETEGDFRDLLTTDTTFVDQALATLYGMPAPGGGTERAQLPPDAERGGLIGRAAMMTILSHATLNSPTLRGRFVRARMLCQDIPPPPEGVVASLDELPDEGPRTLREKLSAHMEDEACVGCHSLMDPLGFTLEGFDPIGRWRDNDEGMPLDLTGDLDGMPIEGAAQMGRAVANHPGFTACVARQLYRHAGGHLEQLSEARVLSALSEGFEEDDFSFKGLVLRVVMSEGFRLAVAPLGEPCEQTGEERACESACGQGIERCGGGVWQSCTAPPPGVEVCDGADNDCDGQIDEDLIQACGGNTCGGAGVQLCAGGAWAACDGPPPPTEICDGVDNDCDGQIDEDLSMGGLQQVSFSALAAQHPPCNGSQERRGPNCNAAIHRHCGSTRCAATGFGPVEVGPADATIVCLGTDEVQFQETTYGALAAKHEVCDGNRERYGPNCNAAIHRLCADQGLTSGYGPLENSGDSASVACLPASTVVHTTYTELSGFHNGCTAGIRIGPDCDAAINRLCRGRDFLSGFGPVENINDIAVITCVGTPE